MIEFKESDWKILRQLHSVALDRFCEQILLEVEQLQSDSTKSFHERYLAISAALQTRDKEIAQSFNNLRRSTAMIQLTAIKARGLLTDDEFSQFSQETRDRVALLLEG